MSVEWVYSQGELRQLDRNVEKWEKLAQKEREKDDIYFKR